MPEQIDSLDRKILFELDFNSRQSFSELARKVRQGRDRVEYRVERLVELGYIRRFVATINLYRLGLTVYKVYLRLRTNRKRSKDLFDYLHKKRDVYRVAAYDGNWDINVAIVARTPREFYESHSELVSQFHDIIIEYAIYTLIDVWWFRKGYFSGKGGPGIRTGGEPGQESIDQLEYGILNLLTSDARLGFREIAERLDSTPAIVKYRLEQLEEKGIVAGYRLEVDHEKLGMLYFKTQLFLSSYQAKSLKQLFDFCENHPHITFFIRQIGECPLEMEMEVESLGQYNEILDSLREEFSPVIDNFRTLLIHNESFRWLPHELAIAQGMPLVANSAVK